MDVLSAMREGVGPAAGEAGSDWYLVPFAIEYTFWLNLLALTVAGIMFVLSRRNAADPALSEDRYELAGA